MGRFSREESDVREENSSVQFAFEQGQRVGAGQKIHEIARRDGGPPLRVMVLDDGTGCQRVEALDELIAKDDLPERIVACPSFRDVGAFVEYVNRFKEPGTVVFAQSDASRPRFVAILDYHAMGSPMFCVHKAVLELTPTPEWGVWSGKDRTNFSQLDFALFLEENSTDVVKPSGADMLEMAKTLEATQDATFKSKVVLENGDTAFTFDQQTSATAGSGKVEIPGTFELLLSPFVGIPEQRVECRFRYQVRQGVLTVGYVMIRKMQLVRRLVLGAADIVTEQTELHVWEGMEKG